MSNKTICQIVMNNTTLISTFNSDNSKIVNIKTQHQQITTIITNRFLKFKSITKIPILTNYIFFTVITFSNINSFI